MVIDKDNIKTILVLLVVALGIGYAYINSDLNINGTARVDHANWDIHWANIQVESGSVSGTNVVTQPTISNGTTVTYSVILSQPGDYYEFTVDAVNAGAIDAMIDSIDSKLNGATITTLPDYLEYTVSYSSGLALATNQLLAANTTETYKVKVKYSEDINLNQIPATNQTLTLEFTVTYRQATDAAVEVNHPYLYNVLKDAYTVGTYARKYTGSHHDSFTEEPSKNIYHWWADNTTSGDNDANTILDMNNVIFANFCWQMIRTTDTGGVKIIYNGVPSNGGCNNSGEAQQIGKSAFNTSRNSLAYVGYMYNPDTVIPVRAVSLESGSIFGNGVTYSNGTYTLTNTSTSYDGTHHYTCNNTTGTCSTVRYYYLFDSTYIEISDGRDIAQALTDMLNAENVNQTNSTIKTYIDNWYANNMTSYTSKLEDTIFCDDRKITSLGAWNPSGGSTNGNLYFNTGDNWSNDLSCIYVTDKFSMANTKAQLTYPVGLITTAETKLFQNTNIRKTGQNYWTLSPYGFVSTNADQCYITSAGGDGGNFVTSNYAVRPVVSLKPGTVYASGDGSKNNPYIVN